MLLHARSRLLTNQILEAQFVEDRSAPRPFLKTASGPHLTLDAAVQNYDVIEASPLERKVLERCGHPFGGVQ
jgi:hypothetical protein